jgi:hypothetical protein
MVGCAKGAVAVPGRFFAPAGVVRRNARSRWGAALFWERWALLAAAAMRSCCTAAAWTGRTAPGELVIVATLL